MGKSITSTSWRVGAGLAVVVIAAIFVYALRQPPTTISQSPSPSDASLSDSQYQTHASQRSNVAIAHSETPETTPNTDAAPQYSKLASRNVIDKTITIDNKTYPLRTYQPLFTPNDPYGTQSWTNNARFTQAWDIPASSTPATIAIIDTGIALGHEDFSNRWYKNTGELGSASTESPSVLNCTDRNLSLSANCNLVDDDHDGVVDNEIGAVSHENPSRRNCSAQGRPLAKDCNLIDDDKNGYVDDASGWDFINGDNSPQAGQFNSAGSGTTHGTAVTGVAAATGNNNKGIAGANWEAKILPLQALDDDSYGDTYSVGRAILYAAAQKADVINISLGSSAPDPFVQQAIHTAIASGSIVVAASGNDGCDCIAYPANYPEVVSVGALNESNQRASFSSWGNNIDIVAPGTNITTTDWSAGNPVSSYSSGWNGTSFAAPLVSGLLAKLHSYQPTATQLQLFAAITENTNRLSVPSSIAHDAYLGFGGIDSNKATQRMVASQVSNQLYAFSPVSLGNISSLGSPAEKIGTYGAIQCSASVIGSTPIYRLVKGSDQFLTISSTEMSNAVQVGYTSQFFSYICLEQPHDTATSIRNINVFHEFYNTYPKR